VTWIVSSRGVAIVVMRAIAIGIVFAVARTTVDTSGRGVFAALALEALGGAVLGLWLALIATRVVGSNARAAVAVGALVFVNLVAVMIEGAAFAPATQSPGALPIAVLLQMIVAILVGTATIAFIRRPRSDDAAPALPAARSAISWVVRYATCALVYVGLYFVVGAINYTLVTGPYYRSGVAGLVVPPPELVLFVAAVEGALMPLAVLPLLYVLPGSRRRRALISGTSLFVLGAVVPLIVAPSLPLFLRVSSAIEILFQKFPAGAAAAALLGPED